MKMLSPIDFPPPPPVTSFVLYFSPENAKPSFSRYAINKTLLKSNFTLPNYLIFHSGLKIRPSLPLGEATTTHTAAAKAASAYSISQLIKFASFARFHKPAMCVRNIQIALLKLVKRAVKNLSSNALLITRYNRR